MVMPSDPVSAGLEQLRCFVVCTVRLFSGGQPRQEEAIGNHERFGGFPRWQALYLSTGTSRSAFSLAKPEDIDAVIGKVGPKAPKVSVVTGATWTTNCRPIGAAIP